MIRVNCQEMEWEEGLTVEVLLQRLKENSSFKLFGSQAMVIVNNEMIPPEDFSTRKIQDGDEIRIYPFVAGG